MAKRKAISKKLRFEVFKRDGFKCQYCGRSAPDVLLEVDHIVAVAKGGSHDILNFTTACVDCNAGKRDRALDDQSMLHAQRAQLQELSERREQMKMMIRWRAELETMLYDAAHSAAIEWESVFQGQCLNDLGRAELLSLIKKFGLVEVLAAIDISRQYGSFASDGTVDKMSAQAAFRKLAPILTMRAKPPNEQAIYYIRGIVRNRFTYCNEQEALRLLREAVKAGADVEDLKHIARTAKCWSGFVADVEAVRDEADY